MIPSFNSITVVSHFGDFFNAFLEIFPMRIDKVLSLC